MRFLILLLISFNSFSQTYSSYYIKSNSDVNVKADVNIKTESNVNKTITTIDYGALRLANAQKEKNRLEAQIYSDEKSKQDAIAIALDPYKAFFLGKDINERFWKNKNILNNLGFKFLRLYHKRPNPALFSFVGNGYNYRNENEEGVVTDLEIGIPLNLSDKYIESVKNFLRRLGVNQATVSTYFGKTESFVKSFQINNIKVGEISPLGGSEAFIHKLDLNKARVWGNEGFVWTVIFENDYEYVIKDNFTYLSPQGYLIYAGARYRGDKDVVDFEMLEGRRAYFRRLINEHIATARFDPSKF